MKRRGNLDSVGSVVDREPSSTGLAASITLDNLGELGRKLLELFLLSSRRHGAKLALLSSSLWQNLSNS